MGDGSADFCLFGKLKIKGKCETSTSRYSRRMEGKLELGSQNLHVYCILFKLMLLALGERRCVLCETNMTQPLLSHIFSCQLQRSSIDGQGLRF